MKPSITVLAAGMVLNVIGLVLLVGAAQHLAEWWGLALLVGWRLSR